MRLPVRIKISRSLALLCIIVVFYFVRVVVSKFVMLGDKLMLGAHTIVRASHFHASPIVFTYLSYCIHFFLTNE